MKHKTIDHNDNYNRKWSNFDKKFSLEAMAE